MTRAFIAIGSNLGDRAELVDQATARLARAGTVVARSRVLETEPVGPVADQPRFLNCVVAVDTALEPRALLDVCLAIERELGRVRDPARAKGPRTMDLDILIYDALTVHEPDLTIPHPALGERDFWTAGLTELGRSRGTSWAPDKGTPGC